MKKKQTVYMVKQYQPTQGYNGDTIYIFSKEEEAVNVARDLNKTYGDNCIFNMDGDYEETLNEENCHFYLVEPAIVDTEYLTEGKYYDFFVIKVGWAYVGEDDTRVDSMDRAKKFDTWDEARSFIKVLESLDIYEHSGPLYIKGGTATVVNY